MTVFQVFGFDFCCNDINRRLLPPGYIDAISCRHDPGLFRRSCG